jgi:hypothetical protein
VRFRHERREGVHRLRGERLQPVHRGFEHRPASGGELLLERLVVRHPAAERPLVHLAALRRCPDRVLAEQRQDCPFAHRG